LIFPQPRGKVGRGPFHFLQIHLRFGDGVPAGAKRRAQPPYHEVHRSGQYPQPEGRWISFAERDEEPENIRSVRFVYV